jgi:hypothetical protein
MMDKAWTRLAEQRVYARPSTEEDAKAALEWLAAHEGKTLAQLVEELQTGAAEGTLHA